MKGIGKKLFAAGVLCLFSAFANAGTLTVQSPTANAFLGQTNTLRFIITGAKLEVTVKAEITGPTGTTTIERKFTPDGDGEISNSLSLNFSETTSEGDYSIKVSATEPANTYEPATIPVKVDVKAPKVLEFYPATGQHKRGTVKIRARLQEPNLKSWEVLVNDQPIANNTGSTTDVSVDWNTAGIARDGNQSISLKVTDEAGNETNRSVNITLDRVQPTVTIVYPQAGNRITPQTTIPVIVDIADASTSSVDVTGVEVVLRRMDGTYLASVARVSITNQGSTTLRWTGRIRSSIPLPSKFKVVVDCIDKAGNRATKQEVSVTIG